MRYEVSVDNLSGSVDVDTAEFAVSLSGLLTNIDWVCAAEAGASCPASGSGVPNHAIALDAGTAVLYRIDADVPGDTPVGTELVSAATISVTDPYDDDVAGNNTATTLDEVSPIGIFGDGFETPTLPRP
jgi:hypothetical protein